MAVNHVDELKIQLLAAEERIVQLETRLRESRTGCGQAGHVGNGSEDGTRWCETCAADTARSDLAASKEEVEQREAAARGVFEHIAKLHPEMPGPVEGKAVETLGAFAVDWWTRWQETQAEVERLRGLLSEWYGCREYFLCDEGLVARTRAALTPAPAQPVSEPYKLPAPAAPMTCDHEPCVICGKPACKVEGCDEHKSCQLSNKRWVCSEKCWDVACAVAEESPAPAAVPAPAEVCECGHGGDWHTRRSAYGCLVSGCICTSFRPAPAKSNKEGN